MIAKNYSDVRNNFKEICDKVVDDSEAVIVKRKDDRDVVVISLDEYSNMMENSYLRDNPVMHERLLHSMKQADSGDTIRVVAEDSEEYFDE